MHGPLGVKHENNLKVLNLMLKKDGEDQFDRACEIRSVTYSQGTNEHPT